MNLNWNKIIGILLVAVFIIFFIKNFFLFMAILGTVLFMAILFFYLRYRKIKKELEKQGFDNIFNSNMKGSSFKFYSFNNFPQEEKEEDYTKYKDYPENNDKIK